MYEQVVFPLDTELFFAKGKSAESVGAIRRAEVTIDIVGLTDTMVQKDISTSSITIENIENLEDMIRKIDQKSVNILKSQSLVSDIHTSDGVKQQIRLAENKLSQIMVTAVVYDLDNNDNLTSQVSFYISSTKKETI